MTKPDTTRRKLIGLSGSAALTALAGCASLEESLQKALDSGEKKPTPETDPGPYSYKDHKRADKEMLIENMEYEIPPVDTLHPFKAREVERYPVPGVATVLWKTTENFKIDDRYEKYQFPDKLTFELFYYTNYPVGNEIDLTKLTQKTTGLGYWNDDIWIKNGTKPAQEQGDFYPLNKPPSKDVYIEYDPADLPRNQPLRFRLRITNNRTGKQKWAHDEGMVYYLKYNDELEFFYLDKFIDFGVRKEDPAPDMYSYDIDRILKETDEYYKFVQRTRTQFPSTIHKELPYSQEVDRVAETEYDWYQFPHDILQRGDIVDIPRDGVELAKRWYTQDMLSEYQLDSIQFRETIPSEYNYEGLNTYNVLDNPLLTSLANNINQAMEDYGVGNHYARIQSAVRLIQASAYSEEKGTKFQLPEYYFSETGESDCSSHSMNLVWLLYHLGYPVGSAYLNIKNSANHVGPVVGVPERVVKEQFPDYLEERLVRNPKLYDSRYDSPVTKIGQYDDFDGLGIRPESLGDLLWIYIESTLPVPIREDPTRTGPSGRPLGKTPISYSEMSIEYILEPDDPWFETGISNTLPKR